MLWLYLTAFLPIALLLLMFLHDRLLRSLPVPNFTPSGRSILLVDDDMKVCEITGRQLKQRGFAVLVAPDGETALRLAKHFPGHIDLLVTDVIMPGMSGVLLADHLQTLRPLTPVLFISGVAEAETLPYRSEPKVDFLSKPFTADTLTQKIGHVLRAPQSLA